MKKNTPLEPLNKKQLQAVNAVEDKAAATFASAGTGKTKALIFGIDHLIVSQHIPPRQILAITFSRKPIREIRKRLGALKHAEANDVSVNTIHALAASILNEHGDVLGFDKNFTLVSKANEHDLIKCIMKSQGYNAKGKIPEHTHRKIEQCKNLGLWPNQIQPATKAKAKLIKIYTAYQNELKARQLITYSDQILYAVKLLREHEAVRAEYHDYYRHILVDEFQDINPAQYELIRLLVGKDTCIWIVGDDDQSIYAWRGAGAAIMQQFVKDYNVSPIILERNYRSTGNIVEAAKGLIEHNNPDDRQEKSTYTKNPLGKKIKIYRLADANEEAEYIVKHIARLIEGKKSKASKEHEASKIAVLVRLKKHYAPIQKLLKNKGIDCHLSDNKHITEKKAVKIALAYLRAVTNPKDSQSILTIINTPKRGIGNKTIKKIEAYSAQGKIPLWKAITLLHNKGKINKVGTFVSDFLGWRQKPKTLSPRNAVDHILNTSGYANSLKHKPEEQSDIQQMLDMVDKYDSISAFLKAIMLDAYESDVVNKKAVNLLTVHAAKSLEFNTVFLPAWEDGVFPDHRALSKDSNLQEERRLAYVGITRAKKRVYITHIVKKRRGYGDDIIEVEPSRFITELPVNTRKRKRSKQASKALKSLGAGTRKSCKIRKNGVVSHNGDYGYGRVLEINGDQITVLFNDISEKKTLHKDELTKA